MCDKGTARFSPYQTFRVNILLIFSYLRFRHPLRGKILHRKQNKPSNHMPCRHSAISFLICQKR